MLLEMDVRPEHWVGTKHQGALSVVMSTGIT